MERRAWAPPALVAAAAAALLLAGASGAAPGDVTSVRDGSVIALVVSGSIVAATLNEGAAECRHVELWNAATNKATHLGKKLPCDASGLLRGPTILRTSGRRCTESQPTTTAHPTSFLPVSVDAAQYKSAFAGAVADGRVGDRLWLYATYHCNLACSYCLTESHPGIADRRALPPGSMLRAVEEAAALGFGSVGITGGEVFMLPSFAATLVEVARVLPTVALSNGSLFTDRVLDELEPLADLDAAIQLSLDSDDPAANDALRGEGNFAGVVGAIARLRERGIRVRIATTVADDVRSALEPLCELHRSLGVPDEDHIVRGVVRRGRAATEQLGTELGPNDVLPELTLTADGVFLHPFAPTVENGITATDLRVGDELFPLAGALSAFLDHPATQARGADVVRNVR